MQITLLAVLRILILWPIGHQPHQLRRTGGKVTISPSQWKGKPLTRRLVAVLGAALLGCIAVGGWAGGASAQPTAPVENALVIGTQDEPTEANDTAAVLRTLGYQVTLTLLPGAQSDPEAHELPDLSHYRAVWSVARDRVYTQPDLQDLESYVEHGGGLFLGGVQDPLPAEGDPPTTPKNMDESIAQTVLGNNVRVTKGGAYRERVEFSPEALDNVNLEPNVLGHLWHLRTGGVFPVGARNALTRDGRQAPDAGFDEIDMPTHRGRLVIYTDNWSEAELNPEEQNALLQNLQVFLEAPSLMPPAVPGPPQIWYVRNQHPEADGRFYLRWEVKTPTTAWSTYTLQHANTSGEWTTVATGLSRPEYEFGADNPEEEGTWSYRVTESNASGESQPSPHSEELKVDKTAPNPPTAAADREPDYAGGGGWYKDNVTVSFLAAEDPLLSDGSAGSGVDPATLTEPQTFATSGTHIATGTVSDNVGNVSAPETMTVQVDATPPTVEVSCPQTAIVGSSAAGAVAAHDDESGLANDPSGSVPIDTNKAGQVRIERTASDNVGHSASGACTTEVTYTRTISSRVTGTIVVKEGEALLLTATASTRAVEVQPGGSLVVEGATTRAIKASKAHVIRVCGAHTGALKIAESTGPVTIGGEGCTGNTVSAGVRLLANVDGVTLVGNSIAGAAKVVGNSGGTEVTGNTIGKNLTVSGNSGSVLDAPNTVGGKTKVQARRG
jgi:hypothetical protein